LPEGGRLSNSFQIIVNDSPRLDDRGGEAVAAAHAGFPVADVPPRLRGVAAAEVDQIKLPIRFPLDVSSISMRIANFLKGHHSRCQR